MYRNEISPRQGDPTKEFNMAEMSTSAIQKAHQMDLDRWGSEVVLYPIQKAHFGEHRVSFSKAFESGISTLPWHGSLL